MRDGPEKGQGQSPPGSGRACAKVVGKEEQQGPVWLEQCVRCGEGRAAVERGG